MYSIPYVCSIQLLEQVILHTYIVHLLVFSQSLKPTKLQGPYLFIVTQSSPIPSYATTFNFNDLKQST